MRRGCRSCRRLCRAGRNYLGHADFQVGVNGVRAAVLEGHGRRDLAMVLVRIKGGDQVAVAFGDDTAPNLAGARQLAVVGVQFLVQDQEPLDLRSRQLVVLGQVGVDLVDAVGDQFQNLGPAGQVRIARIGEAAPFGPVADRFQIRRERI